MKKLLLLTGAFLTLVFTVNAQAPSLHYQYKAYMVQTGTNAPVETLVITNTLPNTPVWTRSATGNYKITSNSAFTVDKTYLDLNVAYMDECTNDGMVQPNAYISGFPNELSVLFQNNLDNLSDCHRFWINIEVYY